MFAAKWRPLLASLAFIGLAYATASATAQEVKIPQTVAEHEAKAKVYKEQAEQYRKLAAEHKQMAAEYARKNPDMKGGIKNPHTLEMTKHCEKLEKEYDQLATDSQKAADYHTMRAKEMQGG